MRRKIHMPAPCSSRWDEMVGDERFRYCSGCKSNVHNFLVMTEEEIQALVAKPEGRLCAQFYRGPDGTMLTQNAPAGFGAAIRRGTRVAGAALAGIMSMFPPTSGSPSFKETSAFQQIQPLPKGLHLIVMDATTAPIPNADVTIMNQATKQSINAKTDAMGKVDIVDLSPGLYEVTADSSGFDLLRRTGITVPTTDIVRLTLQVGFVGTIVVVHHSHNPFTIVFDKLRRIF